MRNTADLMNQDFPGKGERELMQGLLPDRLCQIMLIAIPCSLALFCISYAYPAATGNLYQFQNGLLTGTLVTYVFVVGLIAFVLTWLMRSYRAERKRALLALKELMQANECKTKLLSIISHDLKAPLQSIKSFLEVLTEIELNEEEKTGIQKRLLKETEDTQNMLGNMLCWTKAQMEGGIAANIIHANLQHTLELCVAVQRVAAIEKMIILDTRIDPTIHVHADIEMLRLVVRNLLNNAIKFTQAGGEVLLSAKTTAQQCIISIRDNGIGIPEEKQKALFSLQSGATYGTANEKGVGLGLKLCKEFIELQGGSIAFSSSSQGTEFRISIPLCQEHTAFAELAAPATKLLPDAI